MYLCVLHCFTVRVIRESDDDCDNREVTEHTIETTETRILSDFFIGAETEQRSG